MIIIVKLVSTSKHKFFQILLEDADEQNKHLLSRSNSQKEMFFDRKGNG